MLLISAITIDIALDQCSYCVTEGGTVNVLVTRGTDGLGSADFGKKI